MSTAMTFPGQHPLSDTKGGIDAIIAFFDAVDAISGHLQRARSRQASTWQQPGGRLPPSKIHETMPLQISLSTLAEVDTEVLGWLQQTYDQNC
jgi:hypothetical protein